MIILRAVTDDAAQTFVDASETTQTRSPLWMVTQEPRLNEFVGTLSRFVETQRVNPSAEHELVFSQKELDEVRHAFSAMILRGEEKLHRLSELFCAQFFAANQLSSVVIGEVDATHERFVLTQSLSAADLYSTADIDLGSRQLSKLRFRHGDDWTGASLVANFVEYQPTEPNAHHIHKLISRIKAEEEIWNKVVDELFGLDKLIKRDKQMSHLSHFVKDVFGLKIVVETADDALALHAHLLDISWDAALLEDLHIPNTPETSRLELIETKDYTHGGKQSGWEALKSVVRWWDKTIEIQIQPLRNYLSEREHLTRESHAGFKARREDLRDAIARSMPLFGFYRELLKWLFVGPTSGEDAPTYEGVRVRIVE